MLSELLLKISRNETLSANEEAEFSIYIKSLEDGLSFVDRLSVDGLTLISPKIRNPRFVTPATDFIKLQRSTDTAITTGIDTPISFELFGGVSNSFLWDSADPTKIRVKYGGQAFKVAGIVDFAPDTTGYRNVKISGYTSEDVLIGTETLCSFQGFANSNNIKPFIGEYYQNQFTNLAYFKITVGHTKGSDLTLNNINVGVSIL